MMSPASRARFYNELLTQDTKRGLAPLNPGRLFTCGLLLCGKNATCWFAEEGRRGWPRPWPPPVTARARCSWRRTDSAAGSAWGRLVHALDGLLNCRNHSQYVVGGVGRELVRRLEACGGMAPLDNPPETVTFNPEHFKLIADDMLEQAGVEVLLPLARRRRHARRLESERRNCRRKRGDLGDPGKASR